MIDLRHVKGFSGIILIMLSFLLVFPSITASANEKVYEISINKEIEMGLYQYMKRGFEEAKDNHAKAIILNMHTPGGSVVAAKNI